MAERSRVSASVEVAAPAEAVWAAVTDWERQDDWMLGTTTRSQPGSGVGQRLAAFTGLGQLGVVDTMVVTEWDPPRRCVVEHTGTVVRGLGIVEVVPLAESAEAASAEGRASAGRSRLDWSEELDLPWGVVGRLGFPLVRPAFRAGVLLSLRRLARQVEAAHPRPSGDHARTEHQRR